jgi:hypothetical protein
MQRQVKRQQPEGNSGNHVFGLEHRHHYWPAWPAVAAFTFAVGYSGGFEDLMSAFRFRAVGDLVVPFAALVGAALAYFALTRDRGRCSTFVVTSGLAAVGALVVGQGFFWVMGFVLAYIFSRFQNRAVWEKTGLGREISGTTARMGAATSDDFPYGPVRQRRVRLAGFTGSAKLHYHMPDEWTGQKRFVVALVTVLAVLAILAPLAWHMLWLRMWPMSGPFIAASLVVIAFGSCELVVRMALARRQ